MNIIGSIFEKIVVNNIMIVLNKIYELLKEVFQKSNKLDGYWIGKVEIEGIIREVEWYISHFSDLICATAVPLYGPNKGKIFYGVGNYKNFTLNMSYETRSKAFSHNGTISFRFNKKDLYGFICYLDQDGKKYKSASYTLKRK